MPRFKFAIDRDGAVRQAGAVQTDSFDDALSAIAEHSSVIDGETLQIGVEGFPPARYEYVRAAFGDGLWRPQSQRRAA